MGKLAITGGTPVRNKPFATWPPKDEGFKQYLARVIDSGVWGIGGKLQEQFVQRFAEFCQAKHCVACTSGTVALEIALRAAGIGPGDEVIVPPYTFIATASSVIAAGAIPIFADVDPDSLCLSPQSVEEHITEHTAGIIAVHIAGMPADMDALKQIADKHGLVLIEDCAQAHGAVYRGRPVGAIGDAGCFSFQSSKNITAGEGGAVTTDRDDIYAAAWSIHNVGRVPGGEWYEHHRLGWNYRMTEFQAAVLLRGLELWPEQDQHRQENAAYLRQLLEQIPGIRPQAFPPGAEKCAYHLFIFLYDAEQWDGLPRDKLVEALQAEGIPVSRGYNPLYREPMFAENIDLDACPFACKFYKGHVDYSQVNLPNAERACTNGAFWMLHSVLLGSKEDMDDIAEALGKVYQNRAELLG